MGFIPRIRVLLCAPPPTPAIGGGYLYNQALSAHPAFYYHYLAPATLRSRLTQICAENSHGAHGITHILLDSLYLSSAADLSAALATLNSHRRSDANTPEVGFLAHLLPSQNLQEQRLSESTRSRTHMGTRYRAPTHTAATRSAEAMLLKMFAFAVAPSQFAAQQLICRGLAATRVGVAYPAPVLRPDRDVAHPERRRAKPPRSGPSFLSVGNWSPRKNLVGLLEAFGALKQYDWRWTLVVGDAAHHDVSGRTEFMKGLHELGIQDRVTIETQPSRTRLHGLYHDADCFVMAPLAETYGIVFAEALSYGCLVVAPDTPPFTEFLTPHLNSLLCHPDRTEDWIAALRTVLTNEEKRSRMQAQAPHAPAASRTYANTAVEVVRFLGGLRAGAHTGPGSLLAPPASLP